jgi:hypothetical protein
MYLNIHNNSALNKVGYFELVLCKNKLLTLVLTEYCRFTSLRSILILSSLYVRLFQVCYWTLLFHIWDTLSSGVGPKVSNAVWRFSTFCEVKRGLDHFHFKFINRFTIKSTCPNLSKQHRQTNQEQSELVYSDLFPRFFSKDTTIKLTAIHSFLSCGLKPPDNSYTKLFHSVSKF